jgi:beta-ribofuranosylaminobenzene 5'-phosphate synthase
MIEVRTHARLHLGLLDNNGAQGRLYGSIGLAVSRPKLALRAEPAEKLRVEGLETDRVATYAQRFIHRYGLMGGAHFNLLESIPAHVGLGSGTQIGLAVGTALARLAGLDLSMGEIALAVGRGIHSGIGIATFRHGGFVLDGGHRVVSNTIGASGAGIQTRQIEKNSVPPVLFQHSMPKDWHFVIVIPETGQGYSGAKEDKAFLQLPEAPSHLVEKISRVLLIKMLPAIMEKDIVNFGQALTGIQCMVGDCFTSVQGGRFANAISEKMVDFMLENGAAGIGQSSWGPTVYGLVEGKESARRLMRATRLYLADLGGGRTLCVQPHNSGAQIRRI